VITVNGIKCWVPHCHYLYTVIICSQLSDWSMFCIQQSDWLTARLFQKNSTPTKWLLFKFYNYTHKQTMSPSAVPPVTHLWFVTPMQCIIYMYNYHLFCCFWNVSACHKICKYDIRSEIWHQVRDGQGMICKW
jgi:hypothetical protein